MQEVNSYYADSAASPLAYPPLQGDQRADICIVGAGYTGLSSALHLAERGYSVIVIEAESVGFGASGRNGGHVGIGQRKDQYYLEKQFGKDIARGLWDMGLEAVDTVKQLIEKHHIDCDLKQVFCTWPTAASIAASLKKRWSICGTTISSTRWNI